MGIIFNTNYLRSNKKAHFSLNEKVT